MKISATIITLNEERNIAACLASLDWASEIVVVDSGSSDRTEDICRSNPKVRFFHREWEGFGRQKNMAAELAENDWVFNIDADERVSPQLKEAILAADFERFAGFRVARENYFGTHWIRHCGWYPDYNLRLYDKRHGGFGERSVHEAVKCESAVGTLAGNLVHYTYAGVSDYLKRMDRYSTLAAEEITRGGKKPRLCSVTIRPIFTFFKMYVLKQGFRDGFDGFLLSALYAGYTLCKYAKAREMHGSSGRSG